MYDHFHTSAQFLQHSNGNATHHGLYISRFQTKVLLKITTWTNDETLKVKLNYSL